MERPIDDAIAAFPAALRRDAYAALSVLTGSLHADSEVVCVGGEVLRIPSRLYTGCPWRLDVLTPVQTAIVQCVVSRHHNGYFRQEAVQAVVQVNEPWSAPFVVLAVSEYVAEVLETIEAAADGFDPILYAAFFRENPSRLQWLEARVTSHWNAYHRRRPRSEYVGFRLLSRFERWAELA